MNQLIHTTSPTLLLHQLGWGIPHAMWRNHAYAFYLDSITNGNGNTKFSLAWTLGAPKNKTMILIIKLQCLALVLFCEGIFEWPLHVAGTRAGLPSKIFFFLWTVCKVEANDVCINFCFCDSVVSFYLGRKESKG